MELNEQNDSAPKLNVAVTGSTGLIGSALVPALIGDGHRVTRVVRRRGDFVEPQLLWDPAGGELDRSALEGFDAVIHLAGENIAGGRWTLARKQRIVDSRVDGTRLLSEALAKLERPPRVFVCASAIGIYGDRGDEILDETSPPDEGFLAETCCRWEAAADPARAAGIRVVHARLGVVLSPDGGALGKMLTPFKLGLGGRLGSGKQTMSWIAIDDVVGAIQHLLLNDALSGPVNLTAPQPVTNAEFTRTLARVLRRPAILPAPAFALRLMLGEMADALLLGGSRVEPRRLESSGYQFLHPELEGGLCAVLMD